MSTNEPERCAVLIAGRNRDANGERSEPCEAFTDVQKN